MVLCKCATQDAVLLTDMTPFQGDLKKRTDADRDALSKDIDENGLLGPFFLWDHAAQLLILDGHFRREVLIYKALQDPSILSQKFPYVPIVAETEEDARKAVLQYSSKYGKIYKPALPKFMASIPAYKAPVLVRSSRVSLKKEASRCNMTVLRLKVPNPMVAKLTALLKEVEGVELY